MVTEVHDNEGCHSVWFLVRQICYHGVLVCLSWGFSLSSFSLQILGFALSQSSSGVISTLISSVVLISTSTTGHKRGGIFAFFFSKTVNLDTGWYSLVSAMTSLFCVI